MHVDIILNCDNCCDDCCDDCCNDDCCDDDCCDDNCCDDCCGGFERVHLFDQGCHMIYFLDRLILMVVRMMRISRGWCW